MVTLVFTSFEVVFTLGKKDGKWYEVGTALLRDDLAKAGEGVNALGVCKTQGQYDALTDFTFNLGLGQLKRSTLLKHIKHSAPTRLIQAEFRKWVYAGGKVMPGLVTRRNWEAERFVE